MGTCSCKVPEARAIAYADDGDIQAKLSVALQVLAELKHVLKPDAGLDLNVSKTSILPNGTTAQIKISSYACMKLSVEVRTTQVSGYPFNFECQ